MNINQRGLRLAATIVALVSLSVASWLYAVGQVKALTLDARERSIARRCLEFGVVEGAWIDGAPYCLIRKQKMQELSQLTPWGLATEAYGIEIVSVVPLDEMPKFMSIPEEK